jgi:hypothetical protein
MHSPNAPHRPESPVQATLAALLFQAEKQQRQLQLEVQFRRNMAAFAEVAPVIYQQFQDYQPTELQLHYSDDGKLNLVNIALDNKPVYGEEAQAFCKKQVDTFISKPTLSSISFGQTKIYNDAHLHPSVINKMAAYTADIKQKQHRHCQVPIGFMLITGCGMGYHIEELVEKLDIKMLCIFDPHKDSFYAALHTLDWLPILQKMTTHGRVLKFLLGMSPEDAMLDLKLMTDRLGLFNQVYTFIYRHFSSKKEEAFIELYKKEFHLAASGIGYFDDEQISLAHTAHNINQGFPFFKPARLTIENTPILVIGNGPSLDQHIDYIRRMQSSAIIMSCGTAISSLYKVGITPDFHIEMERSAVTPAFIKHGTSQSFRDPVQLICLNTSAPQMTELFKRIWLGVKPNDLGAVLLNRIYPQTHAWRLLLCNPTVTNAGLSCAIGMGFRHIVLLGIDLGMKDASHHHSSLSIYYDITKKQGSQEDKFKPGTYPVAGNFGSTVNTTPTLHATKNNMETLIRLERRSGTLLNLYNPNDGALIEGATPTAADALPQPAAGTTTDLATHKRALLAQLEAACCVPLPSETIDHNFIKNNLLPNLAELQKLLLLPADIQTIKQLQTEMNRIFQAVLQSSDTVKLLLRGSVNACFTLMMQSLLFCPPAEFQKHYRTLRKAYMQLIKGAIAFMDQQPLQCDTSRDKQAIILAKTTAESGQDAGH